MNRCFMSLVASFVVSAVSGLEAAATSQSSVFESYAAESGMVSKKKSVRKKSTKPQIQEVLVSVGRVYSSKSGEKKFMASEHQAIIIKVVKDKLKVSAADHPNFICYVRIEDTNYQELLEAASGE